MWTWVFHQCCCCCCCRCEHFICSWSWIKITFIIIFSLLAASLLLFWLYSVSHIIGCGRKGSNSSRVVLLESTKCTHEKYVWCEYSIATPSHLYLFRAHMCTPSLPLVLHFYVVSSLCLSRFISGLVAVFHSLYLVWLIFIAARFISHSNEKKRENDFFHHHHHRQRRRRRRRSQLFVSTKIHYTASTTWMEKSCNVKTRCLYCCALYARCHTAIRINV